MNPQNGRQHNHNANYYAHIQAPRTARNKAARAARAQRISRNRAVLGFKSHRSNSSPAAKARQLRRKERNQNKPSVEKQFEHNRDTGITSFALIVTQPEE